MNAVLSVCPTLRKAGQNPCPRNQRPPALGASNAMVDRTLDAHLPVRMSAPFHSLIAFWGPRATVCLVVGTRGGWYSSEHSNKTRQ
jgi:hypothetical protein